MGQEKGGHQVATSKGTAKAEPKAAKAKAKTARKGNGVEWTDRDAAKLKADRKATGLSQAAFADRAGIARQRLSWIEYKTTSTGMRVKPTEKELAGIRRALAETPKAPKPKATVKRAAKPKAEQPQGEQPVQEHGATDEEAEAGNDGQE
jgi:transcriptional regulator with XRE-family HTH domain